MQQRDLAMAPFAGLGFDVSSVLQALPVLHLKRHEPASASYSSWTREEVAHAWGYGLLLLLNQETNGS